MKQCIILLATICLWFTSFSQAKIDPVYKQFLENFPKLSLPFTLTPGALVGSKHISNHGWMSKIYSVSPDKIYAVGIIKDCGDRKTLLTVQVSERDYERSYIFTVLTLEKGYYKSQHIFADGVFTELNGSFCGGCSLTISQQGTTTVTTNQNRGQLKSSASACY